jgi:hypothetical protein
VKFPLLHHLKTGGNGEREQEGKETGDTIGQGEKVKRKEE